VGAVNWPNAFFWSVVVCATAYALTHGGCYVKFADLIAPMKFDGECWSDGSGLHCQPPGFDV